MKQQNIIEKIKKNGKTDVIGYFGTRYDAT